MADATVGEALLRASAQVARRDAETLLAHVIACDRAFLLAHPEAPLSISLLAQFEALVGRRAAREPLQYLTGEQEFYGLRLRLTRETLIPRAETERLVEAVLVWAAEKADPSHTERTLRIADVGTGSGAIAIALATHLAGAEITATDISAGALAVARANAAALGCSDRIHFIQGDLLAGEAGFDAIASNPPYVARGEAAGMQPEVVEHEPHTALFAGEDGLQIYRRLIPAAAAALRPGGLLAMEFGFGQQPALAALLAGWSSLRFLDDYAGIPRVVMAVR